MEHGSHRYPAKYEISDVGLTRRGRNRGNGLWPRDSGPPGCGNVEYAWVYPDLCLRWLRFSGGERDIFGLPGERPKKNVPRPGKPTTRPPDVIPGVPGSPPILFPLLTHFPH